MTRQPKPQLRPAVGALPAYVAGRRAETPITEPLASNESHYLPLPSVLSAIASAAVRANRYPDMASVNLRDRIAEELDVTSEHIAVGPGSVGVLAQLIAAICEPADEVIFAWRSFEAYPILCQVAGATAIQVPLTADEKHDLAAMAEAITKKTKVIILCSPNNPTGTSISSDELEKFLAKVPARVLVVLDEAYRDYDPDSAPDSMALFAKHPNLCLLRTFSKAYGLAGLRVGFAVATPDIAEGLRRTQVPFSVNAVAEAAAVAALNAGEEVAARAAEVAEERERVVQAARELGWEIPDSSANFFWLRLENPERTQLLEAFDTAEILVRGYPTDGIRITIAGREANNRVLNVLSQNAPGSSSEDVETPSDDDEAS